jgi:thiamine kinase-like enzyme
LSEKGTLTYNRRFSHDVPADLPWLSDAREKMNEQHLKIIADQFQLKLTTEPAQKIPSGPGGGHLCWKVKSNKDIFFIKQLDPTLELNNKKIVARYELCESIAFRFAQHCIPAVYAFRNNNQSVIVLENSAYLVYPWIDGYTLGGSEISTEHALKIAEILAKIHVINLDVPEIEPKLDIHTNEEIISTLDKAFTQKLASALLKKNQKMILDMNDRYLSAVPILKEKIVVTHGDVFPHNVIWQNTDQPFLIDWEAVKKWNPTREAIRTCAAWGGVGNEPLFLSLFELMLNTYIKFGGLLEKNHVEAALNGIYGSIINWLLYNINLVCSGNSQDRKNAAINEINNSLATGEKLTKLYPVLLNSINTHLG